MGQLTLVEHALCPLDSRSSLAPNLLHETEFDYSDGARQRQTGHVRILSPLGLSPHDEFFLWGCLSLTLADPDSKGQLMATRHYILRQLGLIDAGTRRGGRQYDELSASLERLSAVRYLNDGFYDPMRAEHRRVNFGFFSYSTPIDPNSSRAWRIAWDQVFFEFAAAARGALRFDLAIYRQLDPASRRLFLFLTKLFARSTETFPLDVAKLAINVLGFSPSLRPSDLKLRVVRCVHRLAELGVVATADGVVQKAGVGHYRLVLRKGHYHKTPKKVSRIESPLVEPLRSLGVDENAISRVLSRFPHSDVREWVDITLAARERFGRGFFRRSPAAYLIDNLKASAIGTRTPPDWWHEIRKAEERARARRHRRRSDVGKRDQLPTNASEVIVDIQDSIFRQYGAAPRKTPQI